jgi:hypothetical protein
MDSPTTLDTNTLHINESEQEEELIQSITQYLAGREGGAKEQATSSCNREWRPSGARAVAGDGSQAERELQQGMAARWSRSYSRGWWLGGVGAIAEQEQELQQKVR